VKRSPIKKESADQRQAFVSAAKAASADEDESRWEARLKAVAKPPAKAVKKQTQKQRGPG
jgi:hypothetical protein